MKKTMLRANRSRREVCLRDASRTLHGVVALTLGLAACSDATYASLGVTFPADNRDINLSIAAAQQAPSAAEACELWLRVIQRFPQGENSFQDSIDERYYQGACIELARAYYLVGDFPKGDYWISQVLGDLYR